MNALALDSVLFGRRFTSLNAFYWLWLLTKKMSLSVQLTLLQSLHGVMRKALNAKVKKRLLLIMPKIKTMLQIYLSLHFEIENDQKLIMSPRDLVEQLQMKDVESMLATLLEQMEFLVEAFPEDEFFNQARGDVLETYNEAAFLFSRLTHLNAAY